MRKSVLSGMAVTAVAAAGVWAADFPLEFKKLDASEAMSFVGGGGAYGQLGLRKPSALKKEPPAVSADVLYGQMGWDRGTSVMVFRLDESKGKAKGYDRLILDLNGNGDLTDDAVIEAAVTGKTPRPLPGGRGQVRFGPILVLDSQKIGSWTPQYYAEAYVYNRPTGTVREEQNFYAGSFRLKAGWYLETTVTVDGQKMKVGLQDGDANLRLGDLPKPGFYTNSEGAFWYFSAGDVLLRDLDGSGRFDRNLLWREACPFGPVMYLGQTPYRMSLAADCKSLKVEAWDQPLAELAMEPQGDAVRALTVAWESAPNQWVTIEPGVSGGKVRVPPGQYRLRECLVAGRAGSEDQVGASGYSRALTATVEAVAGKTTTLRGGAPLEVKIEAKKERRPVRVEPKGFFGRLFGNAQTVNTEVVQVNAKVTGSGGEDYNAYARGKDFSKDAPKPKLTILDEAGKQLVSGNLEYG